MRNQEEENKGLINQQDEIETNDIQFNQISLNPVKVRLGFIRKVYTILFVQVLCTVSLTVLSIYYKPYRNYLITNQWIFLLSILISFISIYALSCYRQLSKQVPHNYIFLGLFTICESILVSYATSQYNHQIILTAALMTLFMFIGLTVYAFTTKTDFTFYGGILSTMLFLLIGVGFLAMFIHIKIIQIVYCFGSLILFSIYLIYDTQLLVGEHRLKFDIDDYILASLAIYLDLINIFLQLLQLLSLSDRQLILQ